MFRALTANLVAHERIETTDAKAKELRRVAERLITRARRLGPIAYTPKDQLSQADLARRQAAKQQMGRFLRRFATVEDEGGTQQVDLIEKVFVQLAPRYRDRRGGYTRIIKVGHRRGDYAPMSVIELVDSDKIARITAPTMEDSPPTSKERASAEQQESAEGEAAEAVGEGEAADEAGESAEGEAAEAVGEGEAADEAGESAEGDQAKDAEADSADK
jgi:large subunit ribosomal protein L17